MSPYILLYKTLVPWKYRQYLQLAGGNRDKCHETLQHGTFYEEYDAYDFAEKNEAERRSYLTDALRDKICRKVNSHHGEKIIANKYATYLRLKNFYHRKIWLIQDESSLNEAASYGAERGCLVIKPADNCGGRGVQLLMADSLSEWHKVLEKHRGWMAEERIIQDEQMARWNPSSVNTLRTNTFLLKGEVKLFTAFIRTGRKNSFVDNGLQGGIFASVDTDSGQIFTDGYNEHQEKLVTHPDSGTPFRGEVIPRWDEAVDLSKAMALSMPEMVYIGWDLALTPAGWEPVEANRGEFIAQQITQGHGLRKEFEQACGLH